MILFVDLAKSFGGAEIRVLNSVREISAKRACGVVVLKGSPLHELLLREKTRVYPLPYRRRSMKNGWAIRRIIRDNGVLLVDSHNPQSHLWSLAGMLFSGTARGIVTAHSSRDVTVPYMKSYLHALVLKICSWYGSHFVAVSNSVKDYLAGLGIPEKRISLIGNGLPIRRMINEAQTGRGFRESIGWRKEDYIVTVVGRLESIKGQRYLIEALPEILDNHSHVRCCVVGTGRCETALKQLVEDLQLESHVHFTGFRNDVAKILAESDMLCMPSLSEGLPYTLLEACIYKVPIVASRVGGIPEFLEDKISALLVEPGNPGQIAQAIMALAADSNYAMKLSRKAFEVVSKDYEISATINKTLALYDRITTGTTGKHS